MKEKLKINKAYRKWLPNNCPIIEKTADGVVVGTCTFYMKDGKTCPRHGNIEEYEEEPDYPTRTKLGPRISL